jgi:hypothetical protein
MSKIERKFLDYNGLTTFWNNINANFALKSDAVGNISIDANDKDIILHVNSVNGSQDDINFPIANDNNAGAITSDMYETIINLQAGEGGLVPIIGVNINGNQSSLNDRYADIKLEYTPTDKDGKSWISLIDSRFIGGAQ